MRSDRLNGVLGLGAMSSIKRNNLASLRPQLLVLVRLHSVGLLSLLSLLSHFNLIGGLTDTY
jgi:hypothetical protein